MYLLTDYVSEVANNTLVPAGLVMCIALIIDDLQNNRCGFNQNRQLPEKISNRREYVLGQIAYLPQIVDEIADEDFSKEFRAIFKEIFEIDTPKRVKESNIEKYPEYVNVAVNWWANAIQSPSFDNGDPMPAVLLMAVNSHRKSYSEDEINIFKESLAQSIMNDISNYGQCLLSVDYEPCEALFNAGNKIGINELTGYPWKTWMNITKEIVEVRAGYRAPKDILWEVSKEQTLDNEKKQSR